MVNQIVVHQHVEEAASLWMQRDRAVVAPQYRLKDLARLDERLEAHVDGQRIGCAAAWDAAVAQLEQGAGEVFAASVMAFESDDRNRADKVLDVACSAPSLMRGLISALGWMNVDSAAIQARRLIQTGGPEAFRAGVASMAIHRIDPGGALPIAMGHENHRLVARSMRAAAELGRTDLLEAILARLSDTDEVCRLWAAWAAVRLGIRRTDALGILRTVTEAVGPLAARALNLAARVMDLRDAHTWRVQLARHPATSRLSVLCGGAIGDPSVIPELIGQMENPELARAAGSAFSLITGADLSYEDLDGDAPESIRQYSSEVPEDDDLALDIDADLAWPSPARVARWWDTRKTGYTPGNRYLLGRRITDSSLRLALCTGAQNQRAAAAVELALLHPSEPLFETREHGGRQQRKVAPWIS